MSKIFNISSLPVAKAFPSLDFNRNSVIQPLTEFKVSKPKLDMFIKKELPRTRFLKQFFSRVKH